MNSGEQAQVSGLVTDVFAHRFVVDTSTGRMLADLGPGGAETVALQPGDRVDLWGEMKPSELKVHRISKAGMPPVDIGRKHATQVRAADMAAVARTIVSNRVVSIGLPRRKPNHLEILGRDPAGDLIELHVELDGSLRSSKRVLHSDGKWEIELNQE